MASVNKVILIGNLGRDPEVRYLPSGDAVANFSIATTDKWKDKSGEMQEQTEWHRIAFFGRQAEICGEYLRKGSQVYVEGRLQTRKWTDKDGHERYTTEIRGDRMQMLGGRGGGSAEMREPVDIAPSESAPAAKKPAAVAGGGQEVDWLRRSGRRYSVLVVRRDSRSRDRPPAGTKPLPSRPLARLFLARPPPRPPPHLSGCAGLPLLSSGLRAARTVAP